jgi:hypothetical protein
MKVKYVQAHISSCSGTVGTYVDTNLRTPPSASSLRAHAGIGGSGRWPGWGRYPGAFRERGCNLRPARQRKDGAHRDTDGGRNQQHSYSAHYYLYPTDGGVRFGSLTTSRSTQMLNNQLSGLYSKTIKLLQAGDRSTKVRKLANVPAPDVSRQNKGKA